MREIPKFHKSRRRVSAGKHVEKDLRDSVKWSPEDKDKVMEVVNSGFRLSTRIVEEPERSSVAPALDSQNKC